MSAQLGLFFFGASTTTNRSYESVIRQAKAADDAGLAFVSTPERHFDPFGGPYPNPAILGAALARETQRIQIRAGSVVLPLHNTIKVVEDWSVVDRLSEGRVAISFGSGWNVNDFVLAPDRFEQRRTLVLEQLAQVRKAWRGGNVIAPNGAGETIEVTLHPGPIQSELPVWLTASRNPETFRMAGALGCNVLTHLENQDIDGLRYRIDIYREARSEAGLDPESGTITLMQHTFVSDNSTAQAQAEHDLRLYLQKALRLEQKAVQSGGSMSGQKNVDQSLLNDDLTVKSVLDSAVEKYLQGFALIGSVATCVQRIQMLSRIGVNEVACLTDFIEDEELVEQALPSLFAVNDAIHTSVAYQESVLSAFMSGGTRS